MFDALCFYLFVLFLGILGLPLLFDLSEKQADRCLSGAPLLAIAIFAFLMTCISRVGLQPWSCKSITLVLVPGAFLSLAWYFKNYQKLWCWLRDSYKALVSVECAFVIVFCVALLLISKASQIEGTEKFMDYALLKSISNASRFPPLDPWFSQEPVKYYWFGHLMAASLCKLTSSSLDTGYNIMIAMILAFVFRLTMGIFFRFGLTWPKALLGGALVALGGNLVPFYQMISANCSGVEDWWLASRIIPGTITEFPFFSLLVGDLHAHYIMLPIFILYIMLLIQSPGRGTVFFLHVIFLNFLIIVQILGNPWYVPVALLLFLMVGLFVQKRLPWWSLTPAAIVLPLIMQNSGRSLSLSFVSLPSPVLPFLLFWGVPLIMILFAFIFNRPESKWCLYGLVSSFMLFFILPVASICLAFLVLVCSQARDKRAIGSFSTAFVATGLLLLIVCEVVYLDDPYVFPYERMNTVFKFWYAAWPLMLIGAYARFMSVAKVIDSMGALARLLVVIFIGTAFCYPSIAGAMRLFDRGQTDGLNGLDPLARRYPDDVSAIYWLRERAKYGQVCVEAVGRSYSWSARFSTFTPCSAIIGWPGHETLWRNQADLVAKRILDVETIYTTKDAAVAKEILDRYQVSWLAACRLERATYGKGLLSGARSLLKKSYSKGSCSIYLYSQHKNYSRQAHIR